MIQFDIDARLLSDAMSKTATAFSAFTAALVRSLDLDITGPWYVVMWPTDEGRGYGLHNALYPLPDGSVLVGTDEKGGPLSREEAIEAVALLEADDA